MANKVRVTTTIPWDDVINMVGVRALGETALHTAGVQVPDRFTPIVRKGKNGVHVTVTIESTEANG